MSASRNARTPATAHRSGLRAFALIPATGVVTAASTITKTTITKG